MADPGDSITTHPGYPSMGMDGSGNAQHMKVNANGAQNVAFDQTTPGTTNAVAVNASPATGGISSTGRLLSAVGTAGDATNVKATPGRLYAIQGANVATSARYLKLYNSASAPTVGSGTPVKTLYLPPSSAFAFDFFLGLTFSAGIGFTLTTAVADNSVATVTAGDILALNLDYA